MNINLDISGSKDVIYVDEQDTSTSIVFYIKDNGSAVDLTGLTLSFVLHRTSYIVAPLTITSASSGIATLTLTSAMTASPGTLAFEVVGMESDDTPEFDISSYMVVQKVYSGSDGQNDDDEASDGLHWFKETEHSLYGMETQVDSLAENPKFYVDHPIAMHIDETSRFGSKYNYYFKSLNTDSSVIACGYQGVKINTMYSPPQVDDGFLVISKDQSTAGFEYWNNNVTHQTYSWSSTTETRQRLDWTTCEGYGMSTTFSYEGETYYATLSCSDYRAEWIEEWEVDKVIGWNTDYGASGEFDTMADFCKAVLEANISVDKYNGIARDEKLAFFAGAEDENGTNAEVAIWTDGKVKGLVSDVQKDGESVVDENGVAHIPNSASSVAELTDVELTDLADKEILEWDANAEKWKNVANSGGGGGAGGSSVYSEKQLYKASADSFQNISVTWDWEEYDAYIFNAHDTCLTTSYKQNGDSTILSKAQIKNLINTNLTQYFYRGEHRTTYKFSANTITAMNNSGGYFVTEIVGLKFGTLSPIIYSEEEREVGVWIDGKPLYQISFDVGNLTMINNTWTYFNKTIPNGVAIKGELSNYYRDKATYPIYVTIDGNDDRVGILQSRGITATLGHVIVTVWYTKTTDIAGSGSYNTLEVPMVHYSTSEQVIGTWTDGSTLYQKTVTTGGNPPSGATLRERVEQVGCDTIKYTK